MSTRAVECGQELRLFVPGEYPCVRRFRYRRLLTFLWLQGYGSTFVAMLRQTNAYLCVFHLKHLVSQGQWTEALDYIIPRFLPRVPSSPPSLEARVLVKFLRMQRLFELEVVRHLDEHSLDRRAMWARAAEIVGDRLLLPDGSMGPQHVLPIGFGFAPFRRRRHVKIHTRPTEECVKAGTCPELNQGCAPQPWEGTPATGNVIKPQCSSVPLATDAANRGPSMMRTRAVECGQELRLFVPGEYPCVRRFRYRRLLTFLWLQGYGYTFVAMLKQTNSYFCVFHLAHLVSQGQWTEALDYIIPRFLPRVPRSPPSLEARVLVKFLRMQRLFEWEVVRHLDKFSLDRRSMWARAAEIVGDLANRTPEFKDRLLLPDGPMGPQHVLPIGFGFAPFLRRRYVRKHTRPTRKLARQKHTRRVANIYFDKRMSLPSNSNSSQELAPEIIAKARDDWFRRIIEECVKAATPPELNEGCALQSSAREGTPVTSNVINRECSSVPLATDADIADNVIGPKKSLIPSVTGTGAPVAPICHAMFGDVINLAENSGISSMVETGTMACPAKNSEVISTANAGTGREVCFIKSARQGSHPRKRPAPEQPVDYLARKKQMTAGAHGEANTPQEVCLTESARQGSHPRKRPMAEQMEDYPATKKQLTAGDNV